MLALYNNRLRELKKTVKKDGELSFLTTSDKTGKRAYRRSVTLLMQKAVYNLWGREHIGVYVRYAIGRGIEKRNVPSCDGGPANRKIQYEYG